jgi:pimeloyl-ACP methyl ester carboxylesterase
MTVRQGFVEARGVRFETFEAGPSDGPVVVLEHGAGSSARIWETVQEILADEGFRSIAVGTRGAGGTDHTPDPADYAPSNYAVDLMAVVDALGIGRFTLVGHSLGTLTAGYIARDHRERLEALVQVAGPHPDRIGPRQPAAASTPSGATTPAGAGYRPTSSDDEFEHWSSQHQGLSEETRAQLRRDIDNNPEQRRTGQAAPWPGLEGVAAALDIPTLVLLGDADDVVPPSEPLRYFLEIPEAVRHLAVFHDVGHYPNAQVPKAVAKTLRRFIRAQAAGV